ncbi:BlaI/MecI/CopY family transcriptional regulator [Duganella sp. FT80W]|uniref:BlaI/MecI/CopY family transcriptional regulator n=1 Tax=Duganella guangzhouensis TaxID=2666084 RepID=A0A6I2L2C8_9BURK|nr:BlaI/MecI/CopY family transcriptional regulator [Duganella guangzhouensis]MRW91962.1 BlaI/MecI/CopY family transcriptional regulator [Duganella guangzhouensis]
MKPIPISEAESQVMEVLWSGSPRTAEDVVAALSERQDWQEATIKTLLNRLLKKGALRATKDGRRFLYSPVLTRERWVAAESGSLVDRLFGGRIAPLVAHFGQHGKLSASDIKDLKRLIKELEDDA